ncbi:hypothetical protein FOZ63_012868, partial [Perkinsus olseni]
MAAETCHFPSFEVLMNSLLGLSDELANRLWQSSRKTKSDSPGLVCSSLLDPNIVVRRAASAAAQEVVGRLGCTTADDAGFLFVNLVDYWTVANRSYAATTLLGDVTGSLCVGDPHLVPFVLDHLCRLHLR